MAIWSSVWVSEYLLPFQPPLKVYSHDKAKSRKVLYGYCLRPVAALVLFATNIVVLENLPGCFFQLWRGENPRLKTYLTLQTWDEWG